MELAAALEGEEVVHDYDTIGLTLRSHPLALLRPELERRRLLKAQDLERIPDGQMVRYAGIVTVRQQPETAKGTVFISLEDETGNVQVIVWKSLKETQRPRSATRGISTMGRQVAAWLGLVPRQHSSGGKATLLGISKRGDSYLGTLLIHGARAVIYAAQRKVREGENWLSRLLAGRNVNVASVALANKNARIVLALLACNREFRADHTVQVGRIVDQR